MKTRKTIEVEVPEIDQLLIDADAKARLDALCQAARIQQEQIKDLEGTKARVMEDLKPLAESLGLPERVLGASWDLRRTVRATERVNVDRLKVRLLQLGMQLPDALALVEECTDRTETVSWSVYGRGKGKGKDKDKESR